jgi:hypothetical protein
MSLYTANTERARIDSSGRLLVGTSSSRNVGSSGATLLQLESTSYRFFSTVQNSNDAFGSQLYLGKSRGTAVGSATAVQNGDEIGYLGFAAADGTDVESVCAAISAVIDGTPGSNDVPGRLVFSTTADGASSPTERMRITSDAYVRLASGTGGIQFNGDTAAANALDDYEEGTWTPAVIGSTTAGTATYITQNGRYTKIGNIVHFELFVAYTGGTGAGNLRIDGLPFAPSISNATYTAVTIGYLNSISLSANHTPLFLCASGDSYIYNYQVPSGGGTNIPIPYSGSGSIGLSGTYTTG